MPSLFRAGRQLVLAAGFLLLIPVASASAVAAPAGSRALPIRVPASMGGFSVGTATLGTTYTDTNGTATATAAAIALGVNNVFRIDTCIRVHVLKVRWDTQCDQKVVDTSTNLANIQVVAPTVSMTFPRPPAGGKGYVSAIVSVAQRQVDGTWKEAASSWQGKALADTAVALPPVDAATGTLPPSEGLPLASSPTIAGGVNTGRPDSFCAASMVASTEAVPAGVTADTFGADAPAYSEVGEPSGAYAGAAPKGVMIVVHGGGWNVVGPGQVERNRAEADYWRERGWRTVAITYRACRQSIGDVLWFYDHVRAATGTSLPICLTGGSAGAQLVLLTAWARPDAACVIAEGAPTDATTLKDQRAWSATSTAGQLDGSHWIYNGMVAAWGPDDLAWYSPALLNIHARVLLATAAHDPYIPYAQATEFRDKQLARNPSAYVDTVQLEAGDQPFVHANVSQAALDDFHAREDALVAPLVAQG